MRYPAFIILAAAVGCATEEGFEATANTAALTSPTVTIDVGAPSATIVSVIPMRFDSEGSISWVGTALATADVQDGVAVVTLPARAPARHLDSADRKAPVSYGIFARASDAEGAAAEYIAVGTEMITYLPARRDGNGRGWYITSVDADGELDYASTDAEIVLGADMEVVKELEISGNQGSLQSAGEFSYKLAFFGDEGVVSGWTTDIVNEWSVSLDSVPPGAPGEELGFRALNLEPAVFIDEDMTGDYSAEDSVVAGLCVGRDEVAAVYVSPAYNPTTAWAIKQASYGTGWGVYSVSADGLMRVGNAADITFSVHADCGEALGGEADGGEAPSEEEPAQ